MKKLLIIPIEIYQREYYSALCLAESAIRLGFSVLIGQKQQIFPYIESFWHSTWFLKSITHSTLSYQMRIAETSSLMYTHDIEGLVPMAGKIGIKMRYSQETIDLTTGLFFWGQADYQTFKNIFPNSEHKLHVVGTHISDSWLIKSYLRSNRKKDRRKNNCLVLSSFPYAISDLSDNIVQRGLGSAGFLRTTKDEAKDFDMSLQNIKSLHIYGYETMKELILYLKNVPNTTITLRQHPAEPTSLWSFAKPFVDHYSDGLSPIEDDLVNCDCVFHFNSTASYHASIFGISSCMYLGNSPPEIMIQTIHPLIMNTTNIAYNTSNVQAFLDLTKENKSDTLSLSNSYMFFDSTKPFTSSDKMIDIIDNTTGECKISNPYPFLFHILPLVRFCKKKVIYRLLELAALLLSILKVKNTRIMVFRKNSVYAKRKWPKNPTILKVKSLITEISSVRNRTNIKNLCFKRYPTGAILIARTDDSV